MRLEGLRRESNPRPCSIVPQATTLRPAPRKECVPWIQGQSVRLHVLGSLLSLGLGALPGGGACWRGG
jgi:hypothetical protein